MDFLIFLKLIVLIILLLKIKIYTKFLEMYLNMSSVDQSEPLMI